MNLNETGNPSSFRPKQREKLELIQLYDDVVLFDPVTESGISLNSSARAIWELSDGTRSVQTIVSELSEKLGISGDTEAERELDFDVRTTIQMFDHHQLVRMMRDDRTFTNIEEVPKLTPNGFKVIDLPENTWKAIKSLYKEALKLEPGTEDWGGSETADTVFSELFSLDELAEQRDKLYPFFQPIHEEWCGEDLEPAAVYGFRSYLTDSVLFQHTDRLESHHVSSIIMVEKDLTVPGSNGETADDWPLDIQAHDGSWHQVFLKPGQAVLYESSRCSHGRNTPFKGTFYRNFFVHFKLRHWEYVG